MPPRSKSRKKRSVDTVSFEDLLAAHKTERGPGQLPAEGIVLIGVDLELQRRMSERLGQQDEPHPGIQNKSAVLDTPVIRQSGKKTYTVHPVSRIEDAFTPAERDLLRWLWEQGKPVPGTPLIRLVAGPNGEGARRLAAQANLIYNTFKNLIRALSTKFALDIVKGEKNLPAIYAVYQYSAILERQRRAGFTGTVHKSGGGRELVNAEAQPALRRPDLTLEELGF